MPRQLKECEIAELSNPPKLLKTNTKTNPKINPSIEPDAESRFLERSETLPAEKVAVDESRVSNASIYFPKIRNAFSLRPNAHFQIRKNEPGAPQPAPIWNFLQDKHEQRMDRASPDGIKIYPANYIINKLNTLLYNNQGKRMKFASLFL